MAVDKVVRGVTAAIIMSLSSSLGQIFLAGWMLPLVFVRPDFYRVWSDWMVGAWVFMTTVSQNYTLSISTQDAAL